MLRHDGDGLRVFVRSEIKKTKCTRKSPHKLGLKHDGATPWFVQKKRAQGVTYARMVLRSDRTNFLLVWF